MGYDVGDFETHVARFLEYAASYTTVGLDDRRTCVFVHELKSAGDRAELFEKGEHERYQRTTTFEPVPLDFHLYSVSSIRTDPLSKGGDGQRPEGSSEPDHISNIKGTY